jgi:hypothetical protein
MVKKIKKIIKIESYKTSQSAMLQLSNIGPEAQEIALRKKNEEEPFVTLTMEPYTVSWHIIPLVDRKFQCKISSTECKIQLLGYTNELHWIDLYFVEASQSFLFMGTFLTN